MTHTLQQSVNLSGRLFRLLSTRLKSTERFDVSFQDMRIKYKDRNDTFNESHLVSKEPIGQFRAWFEEVCNTPLIREPNAMCIATSTKSGIPSARFVLLKAFGKEGFKFFTNCDSRKGKELEENPNAALLFYWQPLQRQVRVDGVVQRLPEVESEEYFHSRPFASQVGAAASDQSSTIPSREYLIERCQKIMENLVDDKVPKPPSWGGFLVVHHKMEFWQGQSDRLHDRIVFRKPEPGETLNPELHHQGTDGWIYERLAP